VYESLSSTLSATTLAEVAAGTGGPPYPNEVRRRRMADAARHTQEARNA
jgi:hypothetical protein